MWIIPLKGEPPVSVHRWMAAIEGVLSASRFTARLAIGCPRFCPARDCVKISTVRLRRKKPYCGAHPGPCLAVTNRPHRVCSLLEGADWVGFNGLLNDVLDKASATCDVFSFNRESLERKYYIRKGRLRRVGYPYAYQNRFAHWLQGSFEADFADCCGKAPPAVVDYDTSISGLASYFTADEVGFFAELEHAH